MGSRPAPAPEVKKIKAPPPPVVQPVPTQAVRTQSALDEVSAAQQRLNMELGAQLDRTNSEFFTGQDIRRIQATGAEDRLSTAARGVQERAGIVATGEQYRLGLQTAGTEERATTRVRGEEERKGIETTGREQRTTDLQQEMFRRYKENRDYEQAQQQYRA